MTRLELIFLVILIVNLIITIVYLVINLFRKEDNRRGSWFRAAIMLLCPLTGALMLLLAFICYMLFFHKEVDLADVVFSKDRVETIVHADEEQERNLVPVEEAITVTDQENLRNLMMNVVRNDVQKSLASIALALDSEDSEVAHYAASILQDVLNNFRAHVQKLYLQMKENEEERVKCAHSLIAYMDPVLKQQVFTGMEQRNQVDILDDVCEMLYEADAESMTASEFEAVSMRLLEQSEFDRCKKWCDRVARQYPDILSTYTAQLKLYFSIGEKEQFFRVFNELRESGVAIDRETLEMIRVFL